MNTSASTTLLSKITSGIIVLLAFLTPLFFIPFTPDFFDGNKRMLVMVLSLLALIVFAIKSMGSKRVIVARTPWTLGFAALGISTLLSFVFSSINKTQSITGQAGFLIALSLLFLIATSLIRRSIDKAVFWAVIGSGIVLTLMGILDRVGIRMHSVLNTLFDLQIGDIGYFTVPSGGPLIMAIVLALGLVMSVVYFFQTTKLNNKMLLAVVSAVLSVGLLLSIERLLPGRPQTPVFLSYQHSWSIALDVLKNPRTALFGVGPENYVAAFNAFRPVGLNTSDRWFVQFGTARNLPLDVITTHGLLGIASWLLLALGIVAALPRSSKEELPMVAGIVTLVLLLLLFPPSLTVLTLLTLLLTAWSVNMHLRSVAHTDKEESFVIVDSRPTGGARTSLPLALILSLVLVALSLGGFLLVGKVFASTVTFGSALTASRHNEAKETYDLLLQAARLNPYNEDIRRSFANLNLTLAQALTQKENLTEEEKQTALTLIQQAIRESKAAVTLNPRNPANWVSLANIYQNLIGAVNQADQWAIAAQIQAIQVAPTNPQLRFDLGNIYRRSRRDEQALRLYEQTIQLKPDYANAYYNIADIYRVRGDKQRQLAFLEQTLKLVKTTSADYEKLKEQTDTLRSEVTELIKQQQAQRTATSSAQVRQAPERSESQKIDAAELRTPTPPATRSATLQLPEEEGVASPSGVPDVPQE